MPMFASVKPSLLRLIAWAAIAVQVLVLALAGPAFVLIFVELFPQAPLLAMAFVVLTAAVSYAARQLGHWGTPIQHLAVRLATKTAHDLLATDARPPVVYLRSFNSDQRSQTLTPLQAPEGELHVLQLTDAERLQKAFSKIGPFIAIGIPGEQVTPLGAVRIYADQDAWQQRAEELMRRARLVVFRPGPTEGLQWEIKRAARLLGPEHICICLYGFTQGTEHYAKFKAVADTVFPKLSNDIRNCPPCVMKNCPLLRVHDCG